MGPSTALPIPGPFCSAPHLADGCVVQPQMPGDFGERVAVRQIGRGDAPVPLGLRRAGRATRRWCLATLVLAAASARRRAMGQRAETQAAMQGLTP